MIHRSAPSRRHSQLGVVSECFGVVWFCALLSLVRACVCVGVSLYRSACVRACVWTLSGLSLVLCLWSWSRFCVWSCHMRKPVIDDQDGWAWRVGDGLVGGAGGQSSRASRSAAQALQGSGMKGWVGHMRPAPRWSRGGWGRYWLGSARSARSTYR